jgi:neuronal growth regulator 1
MYVLCWKHDIAVLTAGPVQVTMNPRIRLTKASEPTDSKGQANSGYNLEIQDVRTSDAGNYACQIGTLPPKEIVHTLEVLEPPKIIFIQPNNRLDVAKGSSIKLECRASGNPKPRTIWSRKVSLIQIKS